MWINTVQSNGSPFKGNNKISSTSQHNPTGNLSNKGINNSMTDSPIGVFEIFDESIKGVSCDKPIFGILTAEPNRAIKRCRIRKLRMEYYLTESAVVLVIPKSCSACSRSEECIDDFILQIIERQAKNS